MLDLHRGQALWKLLACLGALTLTNCGGGGVAMNGDTSQLAARSFELIAAAAAPPREAPRQDRVLGYDVIVTGDLVRWRECTAPSSCGNVERTRATRDLLGIVHLAPASVDGREVDVVQLALAPRRKL